MSLFVLRELPVSAQDLEGLEELKKLDPDTAKEIEEQYKTESKYRIGVYSLTGLKEISVAVEDLSNFATEEGLSEQQLKTDAELKLRLAGIKVVPLDERLKIPGAPVLYININVNKFDEPDYYAINIAVSLVQEVTLTREPSIKQLASTWNINGLTGASLHGMPNHVRNTLKKVLDQFLNAYLAVNPKEGRGDSE